ncbi:11981_t:CDS:2 [Ambispora gerdemannii]|uniref:11981_t:CDS:1 n=1 Tax=Ambispora gerdemannii TaxID=144530 RepID=A0A9N9BXQ3_9GLOM|nr:11981_t:CDS:2 [Ambispora gerdemannii]
MIVGEPSDSHENKRVKITTACDTCRRQKAKCNGTSPCDNCERGGYQCIFDISTKRPRGPPKGFLVDIGEKLHSIESLVKEIKQEQSNKETGIRRKYNNTNNTHPFTPNTPPVDGNSLLEPQESFGDDLGSDDEEDVQKNLTGFTDNNYQDSTLPQQPGSYSEPEIPSSLPQITPPPQNIVNQLLEKFFTHFHPFFPIIDRTQLYQQLQSTDNQPSPLLMNAIYAVGASYLPILQDSYSLTTFYELAKNLLDYFLDTPRLSTVQALILLCMVDQGKTSSYRPQSYCFMAIHMAQSMRLHRKNGAIYKSNNKHTKKLVWWSCFILDRLHSLSTGDPLTINEEICDIELPSADEVDDQSHAQTVTIFVHFIRLTQLMGQIISYLQMTAYTSIPTITWAHHNMISRYEAMLISYARELPCLQRPLADHSIPFAGQIAALHMHYYTLKIMLHYPYLISYHSRSTGSRNSETYLRSLNACITAANTILRIGVVSLNNVYVCITYPTMFHCLAQAAKVYVTNITSADRGLAGHAYKNIHKIIDVARFYAGHGVMSELANQTIEKLESVLITHRDQSMETVILSSTTTIVPSNIPHTTMFASPLADHSPSTLTIPNNSFSLYSSPASTHLSSPITDPGSRSSSIHHTSTFTYVQQPPYTQPTTRAFLPDTVTSSAFGSDEIFDPTVSSTNTMAAFNLGQGDNPYWNMYMNVPGSQTNFVGFNNTYKLANSGSSSASVYPSLQHIQYHLASPQLSNAIPSSSLASSTSSEHHPGQKDT